MGARYPCEATGAGNGKVAVVARSRWLLSQALGEVRVSSDVRRCTGVAKRSDAAAARLTGDDGGSGSVVVTPST